VERQLTRIKTKTFMGWGCSECDYRFDDHRPLRGVTVHDMMANYEAERDADFKKHVCEEHLKGAS